MPPNRVPFLRWRPISYRAESGLFKSTPKGWLLHVAVMNGSPWSVFEHAQSPHRRFSHGWVAKDGSGEQYQDLDRLSWAQTDGNPDYWSWETEGFPNEPLTDEQLITLAKLHVFTGSPNSLANRPGEHGIGTHYMGGASYGGHSCPDPVGHEGQGPRSKQRQTIINLAKAGDLEVMDAHDVWAYTQNDPKTGDPVTPQAWGYLKNIDARTSQILTLVQKVADPAATAAALAKLLPQGGVTQEMLNDALRSVLGSVDEVPDNNPN